MRQIGARWMVAAVHGGMAVDAGAVEQPVAGEGARRLVLERRHAQAVVESARVPGVGVALLAQIRDGGALELQVVRAVGRVAVEAALPHRRVLPQERPPLLGMAGIALLVDRAGGDQPGGRRAVRVVAVGARNLALAQRMMGRFPGLGASVLVAGEALLHGGPALELRGLRAEGMD